MSDDTEDKGTYTNHWHGDLADANLGVDPDFADKHLDDPRINDGPVDKQALFLIQSRLISNGSESIQINQPLS